MSKIKEGLNSKLKPAENVDRDSFFFCRRQPSIDFLGLLSARKAIEISRLFTDLEKRDNTNPFYQLVEKAELY